MLLNAGGVYTVHGVVVVVAPTASKSNSSLVTATVIDGSRRQQQQSCPVAAVHRNRLDLLTLDHARHLGRAFLKRCGCHFYHNLFHCGRHSHSRIERASLSHQQRDILVLDSREAFALYPDSVRAHPQPGNTVFPVGVGLGLVLEVCSLSDRSDPCTHNDCPARVRNGTYQGGAVDLRLE